MITAPNYETELLEMYGEPTIAEKTAEAARAWSEGLRHTSASHPGAFTHDGSLSNEQLEEITAYYLHPATTIYGYRDHQGRFLAAVAYNTTKPTSDVLPANHLYVRFLYRAPGAPSGLGKYALGAALEAAASDKVCDGVVLNVYPDNKHAIRLYESLGFNRYVYLDQLEDVMHLPKEAIAAGLGKLSLPAGPQSNACEQ